MEGLLRLVSVYECAIAHVWRAEDNLQESALSFYHVGPTDPTQVLRVGGKHQYPANHLACPHLESFYCVILAMPWAYMVLTASAYQATRSRSRVCIPVSRVLVSWKPHSNEG